MMIRLIDPEHKIGSRILIAGAIIYLIMLVFFFVFSLTHKGAGEAALSVLLGVTVLLPLLSLVLGWTIFWIGTVTGTPLVSFTYGFSAIKRAWRSIVGCGLIVSVLLAILGALIAM